MARTYWLDLFTGVTWDEFLAAGGEVSGFRDRRWKTVQQMKPRDYLLCYLTGISRWIGVLEVASEPFKDTTPIWKDDEFPCRVRVRSLATLTPETAGPVFVEVEDLTGEKDSRPQRDRPERVHGRGEVCVSVHGQCAGDVESRRQGEHQREPR